MSFNLLSYGGWTFLPGLVSGWIQTIYYGITIRAGDPKPQPGSPRYQKHRQRIQATVIIAYLLYTIFEADYWMRQSGDFYHDLGLLPDTDEKKIKSRFRRLAALYHPDKVASDSPADIAAAESRYVTLKSAQDTLSDSMKRFAYERFGPDMLKWQHCSSHRDYLIRGFQVSFAPLYGGSAFFLIILSFTNYLSAGKYWRYLIFVSLLALELYTLTRPYTPPFLTRLLNPLLSLFNHPPILPFQLLLLARKATFTLFVALSQLSGLFPSESRNAPALNNNTSNPHELAQITQLEQMAQGTEGEANRLLAMDMAPFVGDEQATKDLRGRVREWLVTNTIRADPEVRDAMGRALGKRNVMGTRGGRG